MLKTTAISAVCVAPSIAINASHQWQGGYANAGAAGLFVVLAAASPFALQAAVRRRDLVLMVISLLTFTVMTAFNLSNALGSAATARAESTGAKAGAAETAKLLRSELSGLESKRKALVEVAGEQTPGMVEAGLKELQQDKRWTASEHCASATGQAQREFCTGYERKAAVFDATRKIEELDGRIRELKGKLATGNGAGSAGAEGAPIDPQAANIAAVAAAAGVHISAERIGTALNVWFALAVEILGSFGPIVFAQLLAGSAAQPQAKHEKDAGQEPGGETAAADKRRAPAKPGCDPVKDFAKAMLTTRAGHEVPAGDVFRAWEHWSKAEGVPAMSATALGRALTAYKVRRVKRGGRNFYADVELKSAAHSAKVHKPRTAMPQKPRLAVVKA
jgi:hypothetical protein